VVLKDSRISYADVRYERSDYFLYYLSINCADSRSEVYDTCLLPRVAHNIESVSTASVLATFLLRTVPNYDPRAEGITCALIMPSVFKI